MKCPYCGKDMKLAYPWGYLCEGECLGRQLLGDISIYKDNSIHRLSPEMRQHIGLIDDLNRISQAYFSTDGPQPPLDLTDWGITYSPYEEFKI